MNRAVDLRMAAEVEELDLVVGGHSHTLLYPPGQEAPSVERPRGPYPTLVEQTGSSRVVPVVQASCYSKYLGVIGLDFDLNGELVKVTEAEVILLDESIEKNAEVEAALDRYRANLTEFYETFGYTNVDLLLFNGDSVESTMGNAVTDSMLEAWDGQAQVAMIQNLGLRGAIVEGDITGEDVLYVLPFNNTVDKCNILGQHLWTQLELFLDNYVIAEDKTEQTSFLQVAGMKIVYRVSKENRDRYIYSIEIQGEPLEDDRVYQMVITSYMLAGGLKRKFPDFAFGCEKGPTDFDAFEAYVRKNSPLEVQLEGRVTFLLDENFTEIPISTSNMITSYSYFIFIALTSHFVNNKI